MLEYLRLLTYVMGPHGPLVIVGD